MSLSIGKFTGFTPNGNAVYQKIEDGVRIITTLQNDTPLKEIRLKNVNKDLKGFYVDVKDFNTGAKHSYSDITDFAFDENFRTQTTTTTDAFGNTKRIAITKSKDGDSVEISRAQEKANGESFWFTKNTNKNSDGSIDVEQDFETSSLGWKKPDGTFLNGFFQSISKINNGKTIQTEKFGDIDSLPRLNDLV